jgi:hypothetical protein
MFHAVLIYEFSYNLDSYDIQIYLSIIVTSLKSLDICISIVFSTDAQFYSQVWRLIMAYLHNSH